MAIKRTRFGGIVSLVSGLVGLVVTALPARAAEHDFGSYGHTPNKPTFYSVDELVKIKDHAGREVYQRTQVMHTHTAPASVVQGDRVVPFKLESLAFTPQKDGTPNPNNVTRLKATLEDCSSIVHEDFGREGGVNKAQERVGGVSTTYDAKQVEADAANPDGFQKSFEFLRDSVLEKSVGDCTYLINLNGKNLAGFSQFGTGKGWFILDYELPADNGKVTYKLDEETVNGKIVLSYSETFHTYPNIHQGNDPVLASQKLVNLQQIEQGSPMYGVLEGLGKATNAAKAALARQNSSTLRARVGTYFQAKK